MADWGDWVGQAFRRNLHVTSSFFLLRFAVSVGVAVAYILVAAAIQYAFVVLMGESTFNYIAGGLLSLILGVGFCAIVGSLVFMFVRGWHVAALAYAKKIQRSGAPAVTVGMRVFAKNLVSFGAVYGVRTIVRSMVSSCKDALWDLLEDVPIVSNLKAFADNPIIERMASAILDYGFDATVFYLIKNKPEELGDVPSTVMEGLKRYLCCLPSIMLTAVGTYFAFEVIPSILKVLIIFGVFMTQGVMAGILITVLMWPIFYIIENTFFKPMTMMMFMTCFAAKCDEEIDPESHTAKVVDAILNGVSGDGEGDAEAEQQEDVEEPEPERPVKPKRARKVAPVEPEPPAPPEAEPADEPQPQPIAEDITLDCEPNMLEIEQTPPPAPPRRGNVSSEAAVAEAAMEDMLARGGLGGLSPIRERGAPPGQAAGSAPQESADKSSDAPGGIAGLTSDALSMFGQFNMDAPFDEEGG